MFDDLYVLRDRARGHLARGDLDAAIATLLAAAHQTHVAEHEYVDVLRSLAEAFVRGGNARAALTVLAYAAPRDPPSSKRADALLPHVLPIDRAPVFAAQGRMAEAAREMEDAGRVAGAAIYRERARDWTAARALWGRLAQVIGKGRDVYVEALVRFNVARCARQCGDGDQARQAIVASVRLLEEAADHFESVGRRERAFDCFQVLIQVGREGGAFEDVLEGFVNCIRILREDHLKYEFALALFDESIAAATERGESRAAATLAREAAEYARGAGSAGAADEYAARQAQLWRALAQQQLARGTSPEVVENALLAAVLAFAEVGQYARVGDTYRELAALDIETARREHYARAARRYENVKDEPLVTTTTSAGPSRVEVPQTEVWHVDVLEWERQGSAAEVCMDLILDRRVNDILRRKAMLARLTALTVEHFDGQTVTADDAASGAALEARVRLAEQLPQLRLYAALSPLEELYRRPERALKLAVLEGLQTLCYKRSFVTVRAGLTDPDPSIVEQAAKAVEALCFPHAVDPLSRIVRESAHPQVRASALRALARIDTHEAAELVIGALAHGTSAERAAALTAVKESRGAKLVALAREALPRATGTFLASLQDVLSD